MPLRAILLRAFMCLCLVLDGAGSAAAAARMQATGMMGQAHASHAAGNVIAGHAVAGHAVAGQVVAGQADAGMPCHDMDAATAADHGKAPAKPEADSTPPMPDCCKAGACQCACAQSVPVVIAVGLTGGTMHGQVAVQYPPAVQVPALAPDALLRPPIG